MCTTNEKNVNDNMATRRLWNLIASFMLGQRLDIRLWFLRAHFMRIINENIKANLKFNFKWMLVTLQCTTLAVRTNASGE